MKDNETIQDILNELEDSNLTDRDVLAYRIRRAVGLAMSDANSYWYNQYVKQGEVMAETAARNRRNEAALKPIMACSLGGQLIDEWKNTNAWGPVSAIIAAQHIMLCWKEESK